MITVVSQIRKKIGISYDDDDDDASGLVGSFAFLLDGTIFFDKNDCLIIYIYHDLSIVYTCFYCNDHHSELCLFMST